MFRFSQPLFLLCFLLIPLVFFFIRKKKLAALTYSDTQNFVALPFSLKHRLIYLPTILRLITLSCLIVALARPQAGLETEKRSTSGVAIEVAIDRSGSMQEQLLFNGRPQTRLAVVKALFENFALGGNGLKGRPDDLLGIVSFARYAKTVCPLTLAHGAIKPLLKSIKLAANRNEDGTAIGDALALAAARLYKAEETINKQAQSKQNEAQDYEIKSKIIILLTDGQNNAGNKSPFEAAELAAKWGIKIYTIGVGGSLTQQGFFGNFSMPLEAIVDVQSLQLIAKKTGGKFFLAEDVTSLRNIYREIDELEKTEFKASQSTHYQELFFPWVLAAALALILEIILSTTYLRRLP